MPSVCVTTIRAFSQGSSTGWELAASMLTAIFSNPHWGQGQREVTYHRRPGVERAEALACGLGKEKVLGAAHKQI